jgi:meso-butanediol dehydrogenase/(S,S)-butanediol dehydrogenase/diacetyl reductase
MASGRASALALAEAGAHVIAADINSDGAAETAHMVKEAGGSGSAPPVDVTDWSAMQRAVADIVSAHGRLDLLHANAGVLIAGTALTQTLEEWDKTYQVNVRGTFLTVRAVLPQMIEQSGGAIVITASISGMIGEPDLVAYNSSKGALINLNRQLAIEYAGHGIRINCVCPGWIETGFNDPVLGHLSPNSASSSSNRCRWAGRAPPRTSRRRSSSLPPTGPGTSPARPLPSTGV